MKLAIILGVLAAAVYVSVGERPQRSAEGSDLADDDVGANALCTEKSDCGLLQRCNNYQCSMCFYGGESVRTRRGQKLLREVARNDEVLVVDMSGNLRYEPVLVDIHNLPKQQTDFYQVSTANKKIRLTAKHYLYVGCSGNTNLVTSDSIQVGDTLQVYDPASHSLKCEPVTEVGQVSATGINNPIVSSGTLIVNDIYASVYADDIRPLTPTHSHLLLWMFRQGAHFLPNKMLTASGPGGMPYWAYYMNKARESLV